MKSRMNLFPYDRRSDGRDPVSKEFAWFLVYRRSVGKHFLIIMESIGSGIL